MAAGPRAVVVDRMEAIRFALNNAGENDLVLIAGKGHETEQVTGSVAEPFSDQDTIRQLLEEHV
jgi:UDP-N-acetylmuramoyl-L-alanyl-D-glutamate--2,6-diaminopimelate ligase